MVLLQYTGQAKAREGVGLLRRASSHMRTIFTAEVLTSSSDSPNVSEKLLETDLRPFCFLGEMAPGDRPRTGLGFSMRLSLPSDDFSGLGVCRGRLENWCSVTCFFAGLVAVGTFSLGIPTLAAS